MSTLCFAAAYVAAAACLVAFAVMFIQKIGLREYVIVNAPKLISELFGCDFCLCFWISVALNIVIAFLLSNIFVIFASVIITPLARKLL